MYKRMIFSLILLSISASAVAERSIDEQRPMNPDGRLQFSAVTGEFRIVGSDDNQLVISGTLGSDVRELVIEGDDGHWDVTLKPVKQRGRMMHSMTNSRLTLSVPRGAEIEAGTVSGNLVAHDLDGRQVSLRSVSGSIELEGVVPDRLSAETVSGDQRMDAGGVQGSRLRSVSGNINISATNLAGRIAINSVSGSVELDAALGDEIEIETVSGRVRAVVEPRSDARICIASHSGNIDLSMPGDTPARFRAKSFSGGIRSGFGGEVQRGRGPGRHLDHRTGDGNVDVEARSFSGNIEFRRQD